jgi:hypothetical protein
MCRLSHPRQALDGQVYGNRVLHFKRLPRQGELPPSPWLLVQSPQALAVAYKQQQALLRQLAAAYGTVATQFSTQYAGWHSTWDTALATSSSSDVVAKGKYWNNLVQMGMRILPFVVGKLHSDDEVFACHLCTLTCPP